MKRDVMCLCLVLFFHCGAQSFANDLEERIKAVEKTVEEQGQTIKKQQEIINQLQPPPEPKEQAAERVPKQQTPHVRPLAYSAAP